MSSMESIEDLSKYMLSLPKTKYTLFTIIFMSFIIGCLGYAIDFNTIDGILDLLMYGGTTGFFIFGFSAIVSGAITQVWINSIKDSIYMKVSQSMFLSLFTMLIASVIFLIGILLSSILNKDLTVNFVILACALAFAFRTLVIWGVSNVSLFNSSLVSSIQPLLILSIFILMAYLSNIPYVIQSSYIILILKVIASCLVFLLAIYSFVMVLESPMRKNIGLGGIELLSLFISELSSGSKDVERLFEEFGEAVETLTGVISFKNKKGDIKCLFLSPCVHPGPLGDMGGGNLPKILADKFPNNMTMVSHGPSTHDFNPVSSQEIDKIETAVKKSLDKMEYTEEVSEFRRFKHENAKIGVQLFGNNMLMLATFSPSEVDDIEFGVGLSIMNLARSKCGVESAMLVDCHNSFKSDSGRILAGNKEVFQLVDAVEKIEVPNKQNGLKIGCYYDSMETLDKTNGIGPAGLKITVIEVNNQRTAYILLDSNNMEMGFREKIIDAVLKLNIDEAEAMTSDTHAVNTISKGYNPVGLTKKEEIIEYIVNGVKEAICDLEPVEVGADNVRIKDLNTFGPNNSTELVSTISSIVAVSKIIAPIVFLLAIAIVVIAIFYFPR